MAKSKQHCQSIFPHSRKKRQFKCSFYEKEKYQFFLVYIDNSHCKNAQWKIENNKRIFIIYFYVSGVNFLIWVVIYTKNLRKKSSSSLFCSLLSTLFFWLNVLLILFLFVLGMKGFEIDAKLLFLFDVWIQKSTS